MKYSIKLQKDGFITWNRENMNTLDIRVAGQMIPTVNKLKILPQSHFSTRPTRTWKNTWSRTTYLKQAFPFGRLLLNYAAENFIWVLRPVFLTFTKRLKCFLWSNITTFSLISTCSAAIYQLSQYFHCNGSSFSEEHQEVAPKVISRGPHC